MGAMEKKALHTTNHAAKIIAEKCCIALKKPLSFKQPTGTIPRKRTKTMKTTKNKPAANETTAPTEAVTNVTVSTPAPVVQVTPPANRSTTATLVGDVVPTDIDSKFKLLHQGKEIEVTLIQPGVAQKTGSIFFVRDSISGKWLYCFPDRLTKLLQKHNGDLSNYMGRESKMSNRPEKKSGGNAAKRAAELLERTSARRAEIERIVKEAQEKAKAASTPST